MEVCDTSLRQAENHIKFISEFGLASLEHRGLKASTSYAVSVRRSCIHDTWNRLNTGEGMSDRDEDTN